MDYVQFSSPMTADYMISPELIWRGNISFQPYNNASFSINRFSYRQVLAVNVSCTDDEKLLIWRPFLQTKKLLSSVKTSAKSSTGSLLGESSFSSSEFSLLLLSFNYVSSRKQV